jgi:flavin-binding protein dodecin
MPLGFIVHCLSAWARGDLPEDHRHYSDCRSLLPIASLRTRDLLIVCDKYRKEIIAMAKVVKVIELMSQSSKSWEDAAQGAVDEASKTLRNIRSLYIKEFTVEVDNGKISNYRINAKVTFDLERGG